MVLDQSYGNKEERVHGQEVWSEKDTIKEVNFKAGLQKINRIQTASTKALRAEYQEENKI